MDRFGEKAGMQGIDKDKISKIIEENTGEKYQAFSQKKQLKIDERNREIKAKVVGLTRAEWSRSEKEIDTLVSILELSRDLTRSCVHIDMDAFYAAVETRDESRLRTIPMAVGGQSMLSTSNYLARRFGVRAAMPGFIAKKLCPTLEIVTPNFNKYRKESSIFSAIFAEYDPEMSMGSLDEAYIDISEHLEGRKESSTYTRIRFTGECQCRLPYISREALEEECTKILNPLNLPPTTSGASQRIPVETCHLTCLKCNKERISIEDQVTFGISRAEVVKEIRFRVEQATGLTCSAGIAANFMLAKICSDLNKPNGQYELENDKQKIIDFLKDLPIRKVCGIGRVSESHLQAADISTVGKLWSRRAVLPFIFSELSTDGFLRTAMGIGGRSSSGGDSRRKSISVETTFSPTSLAVELKDIVKELCVDLSSQLSKAGIAGGKNVTLKIKLATFDVLTRATTVGQLVSSADDLFLHSGRLLNKELGPEMRLLGVRLTKLSFIGDAEGPPKKRSIVDFMKNTEKQIESLSDPAELEILEDIPDSLIATASKDEFDQLDESRPLCPICLKRLPADDRIVNSHIDECLNKGLLNEMTRSRTMTSSKNEPQQQGSSKCGPKKKSSPVKFQPSRKESIENFFKKK